MDKQAAFEIVKKYLVEQFEVPEDKVALEADLFEELELDSIDALDMVGALEKEMGIPVEEEELKKIRVVEDIVDYIVRHAQTQVGHG